MNILFCQLLMSPFSMIDCLLTFLHTIDLFKCVLCTLRQFKSVKHLVLFVSVLKVCKCGPFQLWMQCLWFSLQHVAVIPVPWCGNISVTLIYCT